MALASPRTSAPTLAVVDGIPTTTSVDVARHFGKRHDDVLKAIRNLLPQLPDEGVRNFAETPYTDPQNGQQYPAYRLTRDGFTLLAMGFTGKKALAFKLAYIDAFNRMEAALHQNAAHSAAAARRSLPAGKLLVDRSRLNSLWLDLGKLRERIDAMGLPSADISHDWWSRQSIDLQDAGVDTGASVPTEQQLTAMAGACLAELASRQGRNVPDAVLNLPADVRPLFDSAVARLCATAHARISAWAVGKLAYGCNLDYPDRRAQRAQAMLDELYFEDWLSHDEAAQAVALLRYFDLGAQLAAEARSRLLAGGAVAKGRA